MRHNLKLADIPFLARVGAAGAAGAVSTVTPFDNMESYADLSALNGLNGGVNWTGPYVDRSLPTGLQQFDNMESYADGIPLNGLNGGAWTAGAYFDVPLYNDPNDEATSWADFAVPRNGGTVSAATKGYAATFITALKTAGIRSKILRLNLYAGSSLAACLTPIIRDVGGFFDISTGFVSGDYSESTGLQGDTSNGKYLNTMVIPSEHLFLNDFHLGFYNRTSTNEARIPVGASNTAATEVTYCLCGYSGSSYWNAWNSVTQISAADANGRGFYLGVRDASERRLYKAGTSLVNSATLGGARPSFPIFVHCYNFNGAASDSTSRILAGYTIGKALTSTEATAFSAAWQAFQTSLGRQV